MADTGTDDVGRLFRQLSLDRSRYKTFRTGPPLLARGAAPQPLEVATLIARSPAAEKPVEIGKAGPVPKAAVPFSSAALSKSAADRPPQVQPQEWAVLESLFHLRAQFAGVSLAQRADASQPPGTALFGICGGAGVTTIVSALGKIEAKSAKRVLLVDAASPSLLPLYFGAQIPGSGVATFISSGQAEGSIYVACGNMDEPLRALASEIDRFYVDGGLFRSREESWWQSGRGATLTVLVPDTRCVVELSRLEREGIAVPYLLLNQFDAQQPLHREIYYRLAKQFNERLIPVTIGRDPDVSVALAQGTTIIDYSPVASVTEDLYKVHEWLAAHLTRVPKPELTPVGQRL